jgi:succinate-acetate transporter protein
MSTTVNEGQNTTSTAGGPAAADPTKGFADPGPLGLAAFALTTFLLSLFNAGIAPENLEKSVLPIALFYGGVAQLIAGLFEFRKANTFGATAFVSYGAFWLSFAAFVQFVEPALPEASTKTATGLFLIGWAIFTLYMLVASLRTSGALIAVFAFLFLTFLSLAVGALAGIAVLGTIGGYLGLLAAISAWYGSFAVVTNATWGRQVFPTGAR